ncbi:MAG: EutN/CcmL family microcompartment protein [Bryobacterales bacterium]|nr:EutN/CcmL family microcompartment protein [Bryobacterales bacterium]
MLIARVIGDLTATQKHASHEGCKILLVQPLHLDGANRGAPVVAVDSVEAGIGDRVLLVQDGYAAMTAVGRPQSPIDMAVVGVVDHVEITSDTAPVVGQLNPRVPKKSHKKHER